LRARTRKFSWYLTWAVIYAIVIAIAAGLIMSLPIWQVKWISIEGAKYVPEEKILSTANVPLEQNIFQIDLDEIKEKLVKFIQFKEVKISRRLPSTIVIRVKEREPFAIVMLKSMPALVDEDGYILAKESLGSSIYKVDVIKFPVIRGLDGKSLEKGVRLNPAERSFMKDSIKLLSRFMDPSAVQIEFRKKDDIIIYIEDVLKVRLGDQENLEKKISVLSALVTASKDKLDKVQYIDVRLPDSPVVKFK
jgi:cell division protein FtsQ